jgi:hypothetical protein
MEFNDSEKLLKVLPPPDKDNCKLFGGVVRIPRETLQRMWNESESLEEVTRRLRLESEVRGINYDKDLGIFTYWEKDYFCQQQYERESLKPRSRQEDPDPNEEVLKKPRKSNREGMKEYHRSKRKAKYSD